MPRYFDKPFPVALRGFRCPVCGPPDHWTLAVDPATGCYDASGDPRRTCHKCGNTFRASEALDPEDEYGTPKDVSFVESGGSFAGYDGKPLGEAMGSTKSPLYRKVER